MFKKIDIEDPKAHMCSDERAMGKDMAGPKDVPVTWPVPQGTIASSPPWKEQQGSASNWKIKMRINIKIHALFSLQNELVPVRLQNDVLRTCYTSSYLEGVCETSPE